MFLGAGVGHLAYSTLVHPGDTWKEMRHSLETYAPAVKARVSPDAPYGLSLFVESSEALMPKLYPLTKEGVELGMTHPTLEDVFVDLTGGTRRQAAA